MSDSSAAILFNSDGYELAVKDGYSLTSDIAGILAMGFDGTYAKTLRVNDNGNIIITGSGTAGTPDSGVLSVQGISGGVPLDTNSLQSGIWNIRTQDGYGIPLLSKTIAADINDNGLVVRVASSNSDGYLQNLSSTITSITTVPASTVASQFLAANSLRKGATFYNRSNRVCYLLCSNTLATTTGFTVAINSNSYYELPYTYKGAVTGVWASSGPTNDVLITEFL